MLSCARVAGALTVTSPHHQASRFACKTRPNEGSKRLPVVAALVSGRLRASKARAVVHAAHQMQLLGCVTSFTRCTLHDGKRKDPFKSTYSVMGFIERGLPSKGTSSMMSEAKTCHCADGARVAGALR